MNTLVFDLQTIPDIDGARRLYDLHGLSDDDVAKALYHKCRQLTGQEILPLHLNKITAISTILVNSGHFKVWSLGDEDSSEEALLQRFYSGLQRYLPEVVSWNGRQYALPVIHFRSLLYPLDAKSYWNQDSQHLSYQSRFDGRHIDLKDRLSGYQQETGVTLSELATLCGFPGKMAVLSENSWDTWSAGHIDEIRSAGQCNALNICLLYLNWQLNCGQLNINEYQSQCQLIREQLKLSTSPQLIEFEKNWLDL